MKYAFLFILCVFISTSAFSKGKLATVVVDTNSILKNNELSDEKKSLILTQQAEWLFTGKTMFEVLPIFEKALELDSSNLKAALYIKSMEPILELKGIINAVEPLLKNDSRSLSKMRDFRNELSKDNLYLYTFLAASPKNVFASEIDLQNSLTQVAEKLFKIKLFINKLKSSPVFQINLNASVLARENTYKPGSYYTENQSGDYSYDYSQEKVKENCKLSIVSGVYTLTECAVYDRSRIKMDSIDLDVLDLHVTMLLTQLVLTTGYDLSGAVKLAIDSKGANWSSEKIYKKLISNEQFGKNIAPHKLRILSKLGPDILVFLKNYIKYEKDICPGSFAELLKTKERKDRGNLFSQFCLADASNSLNMTIADNIKGITSLIDSGEGILFLFSKKAPKKLEINLNNLSTTSISDIRSLGIEFNSCGDVRFNSTPTVGGVFKTDELNSVLSKLQAPCKK